MSHILTLQFNCYQLSHKAHAKSKQMFDIVLFVEPTEEKWSIGPKIGDWYLNWFSIYEDAGFELLGIHYLQPSHRPLTYHKHEDYEKFAEERHAKGKGSN